MKYITTPTFSVLINGIVKKMLSHLEVFCGGIRLSPYISLYVWKTWVDIFISCRSEIKYWSKSVKEAQKYPLTFVQMTV